MGENGGVKRWSLTKYAKEKGTTPLELVPEIYKKQGSVMGAANELRCSLNTVRYWLNRAGFTAQGNQSIKWVKAE